VRWPALLKWGLALAAGVGAAGIGVEIVRFGPGTDAAVARAERQVRADFGAMIAAISAVSARIASDPRAAAALAAGADGARDLFDLTARARAESDRAGNIAVTVYDGASQVACAWAGRASDVGADRISGPAAFFVTPSPLGVRLVHIQPIAGADNGRLGAVATEHVLTRASAAGTIVPNYTLETPLARASLRMHYEGAGRDPQPGAFLLQGPSGEPLVEASVSVDDIARARGRWRRQVGALVLVACAVMLFVLTGPVLDRRADARDVPRYLRTTAGALVLALAGGLLLLVAAITATGQVPAVPFALLLGGATSAVVVAIVAGPVARVRIAARLRRTSPASSAAAFVALHLLAGAVVAAWIIGFEWALQRVVDPLTVDLRHFSLHPWVPSRVVLVVAILITHAAVLWGTTLVLVAALAWWRLPRRRLRPRLLLLAIWIAPAAAVAAIAAQDRPLPVLGLLLSVAGCGVAALATARTVVWYRHTTVAARIIALFLAFLLPALLIYPTMDFLAERATVRLITEQYAVQAQTHPARLIDHLAEAQRQIDRIPTLADLVSTGADPSSARAQTDSAFAVWSQTVLARERLTSAVELYDAAGGLVSRFALNIPEYTAAAPAPPIATGCNWDVYGEAAPFGAEERRMLHAERRICGGEAGGAGVAQGTIILHVVLDYRTLPFITSQSPYFEVFRPSAFGAPVEGAAGGNVDLVIYGWGLQPVYSSAPSAWPITEELFGRIYDPARQPFWTALEVGGRVDRVYFSNDRAGIYAIGYPVLSLFDHLVHLAELTTLAGAMFVLVLVATAVFTRVSRERPRIGRALLREIRASFYRKLFLAFVFAAIVPVVILAVVIRAYFTNLLLEDIETEAARTAAVAQRVIEESDALQRRGADSFGPMSDDVMVWISQVIDQDVNIFDGARLVATSERDLFASGLLPTRTPDEVFRAIVLERRPSFVGQDEIGTLPYLVAAAPVRTGGGSDALLTVPLALRQREIDQEIDELDRGVLLASVFFILLGAAIGLSMAERIADPVRRLTRATRRIALGDFDARIAVRSADELKRLVDAFNSMAAELKEQRSQLERTHRLEAWAEMARQVAHEIKNPLTPIQLSAEHLQRVHLDRGQPMGPVLESCVTSILGQVRLLRQISAEFSSFASSPTAKRSPVDLPELVATVLDPYRTGLAGRIAIVNEVPPALPPVLVDRTLVARALSNVVENALHAMPGPGTLALGGTDDGATVAISVRDTGAGMDEEALARVFEPYFSTKTTGTGLGLPIARRNIELNGGSIDVSSTRGAGTTVVIRLPVAGAPAQASA
jgi:signal transduction histidine kinase